MTEESLHSLQNHHIYTQWSVSDIADMEWQDSS